MLKIFIKLSLIFVIAAILNNCSDSDNPVKSVKNSEYAGNLQIFTDKKIYTHGSDFRDWLTVTGSIVNNSPDTLYSKLGDRYNGPYLCIAAGSDGYFEKFDSLSNEWSNRPRGFLIEGTRIISILPQKSYPFTMVTHPDSFESGTFRVLVKYYKKIGISFSTDTLSDISNVFYISPGWADICQVHLQTWFDHTPVKVYVDHSSVFADTISTGAILAFAAIIPLQLSRGSHNLNVTVADSVSADTTFTINDSLYIGVNYSSTYSKISYLFRKQPFYYR